MSGLRSGKTCKLLNGGLFGEKGIRLYEEIGLGLAVTVTLYIPVVIDVGAEIVSVELPCCPKLREILAGLREAVGPADEMDVLRVTVPANPKRLARETAEVPDAPPTMLRVLGFEEMPKPATLNGMLAATVEKPSVPVTVTV